MPSRTDWEKQQAVENSKKLLGSSTRIFYFDEAVSVDIASSQRPDACWVTIARKNFECRTAHILKHDLSDYFASYHINVGEYQCIPLEDQLHATNPWQSLLDNRLKSAVYFVAPETGGNIKIGFTTDLIGRFKALQAQSPVILKICGIIPGGQFLEQQFHMFFSEYRSHYEWFIANPDLNSFARSLGFYFKRFAGYKLSQRELLKTDLDTE